MTMTGTPRKFGGWLMLLVALLLVAAGAMAFQIPKYFQPDPVVADYYGDRWIWLQAVFTISALVMVLGNLYLCFKLTGDYRWRTVRLTIAGLWIIFGARGLVSWLATILIGGIDPSAAAMERVALGWALMAAFAAIWTVYLLRSKRVAETYPRT